MKITGKVRQQFTSKERMAIFIFIRIHDHISLDVTSKCLEGFATLCHL